MDTIMDTIIDNKVCKKNKAIKGKEIINKPLRKAQKTFKLLPK